MSGYEHKNYYQRLGLSRDATIEEIKEAYVSMARVFHPDSHFFDELLDEGQNVVTVEHERALSFITEAYNTLTNEQKRAAYDRSLPAQSVCSEISLDTPKSTASERPLEVRDKKDRVRSATFGVIQEAKILRDNLKQEAEKEAPPLQSVAEMIQAQRHKTGIHQVSVNSQKRYYLTIGIASLILVSLITFFIFRSFKSRPQPLPVKITAAPFPNIR